jgi:uncharacterized membrane-anchored protein
MLVSSGIAHVVHAVIVGIVLYLIMYFLLRQRSEVAENRSILIAAVVLVYMILFGHGLPTSLNKNLM